MSTKPPGSKIIVAPDIPSPPCPYPPIAKEPGALRLVFLSRIAPMKNLDGALRILSGVEGDVVFDIYGPRTDLVYWERCMAALADLPATVRAEYKGTVAPHEVARTIGRYHAFFLPTHGENYGHVIAEALGAARLVIISDRTPWRNLQIHGLGWDLPLEDPGAFRSAIEALVEMGQVEFSEMVDWITYKWPAFSGMTEAISANLRLFRTADH